MGIDRSALRAFEFGTAQFEGLGLTHLAALQGHTRLQYLLGHLRCGDTNGRLVQMLLEYTLLECGCHGNPLAQDYNKYSALLINTNWIMEVWEHLYTCKATVEVEGLLQPEANRQQDTVIFFISYITSLEGKKIEERAGRGQRQVGRQSTWEWPIQQRPTAWKAWKTALEYIAPNGHLGEALGDWRNQNHQMMGWYLDAHTCTLYHHAEGVQNKHDVMNIVRLRFQVDAHSCDAPNQYTHVVDVYERVRYMEILSKHKISETQTPMQEHPIEYTSGIRDSCCTLPRHI
jgi:hypothetical protein